MVPFVLPSSLQIAEQASKDDYVQHILPSLKPVMKMLEPIQATANITFCLRDLIS